MNKTTLAIFLTLVSTACFADNWECVSKITICRYKVPHGWLVARYFGQTIAYYPDEKHEWKI